MYFSFTINHPVSKPHYLHLYPHSSEKIIIVFTICIFYSAYTHHIIIRSLPLKYKVGGVACMIKYDPLWQTLKAKNISQYQLIKDYGIDKAQLQRLRQNMVVKTIILNRLCQILDCWIEDIMEYVPDDK
jgi:putative transcriptional regulator